MVCSVYDMRTLEVVKTLRTPKPVSSVEVEPGQQRYITTADGPNVSFWDGQNLDLIKTHVEAFNVNSASLCADRRRFVLGGEDMWVHLHDYDTLKELECNKGEFSKEPSLPFLEVPDSLCWSENSSENWKSETRVKWMYKLTSLVCG